jgi:biopolymer transport protein ExbD
VAQTYFHRMRLRRAERAVGTQHGGLNLVPLVDILTSIVFFSLLTYAGAALAALTSFDLNLPPSVVTTPEQARQIKSEKDVLNLLLAVRLYDDRLEIEHSAEGGFHKTITGTDAPALEEFETLMAGIRNRYPQNKDVLVLPADGIDYDRIVHVLERLKRARYSGIALGTRARNTPVTPP